MSNAPTILHDSTGRPAFVVLAFEDYLALTGAFEAEEEAADRAAFLEARAEDDGFRLPLAEVRRLIAGENAVKVLREWRGCDQAKLARRAGTTPNYISQIETGARRGLRQVGKLASALDVPVEVLKAYL